MNNKAITLSLMASVNHAADSLGLYRAELARILGLMCQDVSNPGQLESLLNSQSQYQLRAEQFVRFYDSLDRQFSGDSVAMTNWFRRDNVSLGTTPFLALVDQGRLDETIDLLKP